MADDDEDEDDYKSQLKQLQIELVKLQRQIIADNGRIVVLFEGRDGSGKDGVIKRIVQHLSPREFRVVALGVPSERDRTSWFFQRYVAHLPAAEELVLFNRSWYNRAGVEPVMGFCTEAEHEEFMSSVNGFEEMLVQSGIRLFKYYLDISRDEQEVRLDERKQSPLTQWKSSPVDRVSLAKWDDYSRARNAMFERTHTRKVPWRIVHADRKKPARLHVIRDLLSQLDYSDKDASLLEVDPHIVFPYSKKVMTSGRIAP